MSNELLSSVRQLEIKGPAKAVLMVLADRADVNGECRPSRSTIAKSAGCCIKTVGNSLSKLRDDGLIDWKNTMTDEGDRGCNVYFVTLVGRVTDTRPRVTDTRRVGQEIPDGRVRDAHKASMKHQLKQEEEPPATPLSKANGNHMVPGYEPSARKSKSKGELSEVTAFCVEMGLPPSDGAFMFHKWESNGWMNGLKPVRDWKSQIRSWQSAGYLPSQKANAQTNRKTQPSKASEYSL